MFVFDRKSRVGFSVFLQLNKSSTDPVFLVFCPETSKKKWIGVQTFHPKNIAPHGLAPLLV